MLVLAGGTLVLADRVIERGSIVVDGDRIASIHTGTAPRPAGATVASLDGAVVVPGFVDVHLHGVEGHDVLDGAGAIGAIASRLPRYGVTSFAPTTVACEPDGLRGVLAAVRQARGAPAPGAARVLGAHLESNFINPEYRGAQPLVCLRLPGDRAHRADGAFRGADILEVIAAFRDAVAIVTVAPELEGGLALVADLAAAGHRVSLGHSGADFATANAAIDAGARHATHLFNRMPPLAHRAPGLAGAVLTRDEVAAELICDGYHVHAAMARVAIAAKGVRRMMAITDGTACSGLAPGATARLGGRTIHAREDAAVLDDGTLAGSTLTMDRAFANIVRSFGRSLVDAVHLCATTPARELGLRGFGELSEGAIADVVVLGGDLRVQRTVIGGVQAYPALRGTQAGGAAGRS
jgi:N-acetylglucosamine-6-phosphate deacetylase